MLVARAFSYPMQGGVSRGLEDGGAPLCKTSVPSGDEPLLPAFPTGVSSSVPGWLPHGRIALISRGCSAPYGAGILHFARLSLLLHRGPHPTSLSGAIVVSPLPPGPRGWVPGALGQEMPGFPVTQDVPDRGGRRRRLDKVSL